MRHFFNVVHSKLRELAKHFTRSPHWGTVQKHWKQCHPACAACGSTKNVQVHHIKPFSQHPELELADGTGEYCHLCGTDGRYVCNLLSLCMDKPECHLRGGHLGDFKHGFNSHIREDAALARAKPWARETIWATAKVRLKR